MKTFNDRWNKRMERVVNGGEDIIFYTLTPEKPMLVIDSKKAIPSTLLAYRESKEHKDIFGFIDGEKWNMPENASENISFILDRTNPDKLKLLAKFKFNELLYPENMEKDATERLIILQKNLYFCDVVFYDAKMSDRVFHLTYNAKSTGYESLDLLVLSFLNISETNCNNGGDLNEK